MRTALLSLTLLLAMPARSADIVALCIGNDAYAKREDVLDTPVADAKLMKATLEALPGGADVTLLTDAKRADIVIALNALKAKAEGAKLALVFYSGHGMDGRPTGYATDDTFLLPIDAEIPNEDHLAVSAVGLREVLAALKECPVTARAVILDCCRTGAPKAAGALITDGSKSFGELDDRVKTALGNAVVPDATLVAFAASPLRKAASFLSAEDKNSPFTAFVAEELRTGSGNLRDLIETAALKTETATEKRQVPYVSYTGAISAIRQIVWRETAVLAKAAMTGSTSDSRGIEGTRVGEVRAFGGIEMVWCPPGEFLMGSPNSEEGRGENETQHRVILTHGFWLAKTECTQAQWESVMGGNPSEFRGLDLPVENVSWEDVQGWLAKMNEKHPLPAGWKWGLPTEAQWEYACRAGTKMAFAGDLAEMAWYEVNSGSKTHPVGTKKPNGWGLQDMHGNVYEWCADKYGDYEGGSAVDPTGAETGAYFVQRGGSWYDWVAQNCRSAFRLYETADFSVNILGFRPATVPNRE